MMYMLHKISYYNVIYNIYLNIHLYIGNIDLAGMPIKFLQLINPTHIKYPPPVLGEHTTDILTNIIGIIVLS